MFTSSQIINATQLIKQFRQIAAKLNKEPQALMITQKGGNPLVLVNAGIFEDLVHFRHEAQSAGFQPRVFWGEENEISKQLFVAPLATSL